MATRLEEAVAVKDITESEAARMLARVAAGGALGDGEKAEALKYARSLGVAPTACPFCGSDRLRNSGTHGAVGCDNCGAVGPIPAQPNDVEATALWNTRA